MKKLFAYFLPVLILSFVLCGCGRNRTDDNTVVNTPVVTPMVTLNPSPSMMPDLNDGEVTDKDGIITDKEADGSGDNASVVSPVPSPSASTNP